MKLSNVAKNSRQQFNSLAPMGQLGVTGGITGSVPQMDLFSQGAQQARQMTPKPGISGAFDSLQFERYDLPEAPDEEAYQQKKRGLKDMSWAVGLGEGVGALFKAATNFGYNPPGGRLEAGPLIMNDIRALDDEYNRAMENYRAQLAGTQAANVDLANQEMLTNDQLQREKQQIAKADKRYEQQQEYQQGRDAKGDAMNEREFALRERQLANQERQAAFQRKLATLSNRGGGGDSRNLSPYIRFALEDERDQLMEQISAAEQAGEFTKVELLTNRLSELEDVDNLKIDQNAFDLDTKGRMVYTQSKFTEHLNKTDWNNPNAVSSAKQKMMDTYREVYPDADPELMESLINRSIQNYKRGLLMNGGQQAPEQGGEQPPQYTIQGPTGREYDLSNPNEKEAYLASFSNPFERIKAERQWESAKDQSTDKQIAAQYASNVENIILDGLNKLQAPDKVIDGIENANSIEERVRRFKKFLEEVKNKRKTDPKYGTPPEEGMGFGQTFNRLLGSPPEQSTGRYNDQVDYYLQQLNFINE